MAITLQVPAIYKRHHRDVGIAKIVYATNPSTEIDMVSNSPHTDGVSIGSDTTSIRHEYLWFDDGSIVLNVEQTLFRVHRSILCIQSEIFADMFSIPQPNGEATIEGCVVVRLPDKSADFVDLLKAFYEPLIFERISPDANIAVVLEFVSGILRLSTKYYIRPLRQKCIDILKRKIPTSLIEMDAIFGTERDKYPPFSTDIRFAIINLARETDVPELLPFGFYLYACLPSDVIRDVPVLTWKDKAICLAGRDELLQAQRTISYEPFLKIKPSSLCKNRPTCSTSKFPEEFREVRDRVIFCNPRPLDIVRPEAFAHYMCTPCLEHAMLQHQQGRKEVWDLLPGIFQLGSWEDIRNMQNN